MPPQLLDVDKLPPRIAMGTVALASVVTKTVEIACITESADTFNVELQFVQRCLAIEITGTPAKIKRGDTFVIHINFTPTELCTYVCEFHVLASACPSAQNPKYGAPFVVGKSLVTGCGAVPDFAAQSQLQSQMQYQSQVPARVTSAPSDERRSRTLPRLRSAGATATVGEEEKRQPRRQSPRERVVDGIVVPSGADLCSHTAVTRLLMAHEGKRKVKDLKARRGDAGAGGGGSGSGSVGGRQLQEMAFLEEARARAEHDKAKEMKSFQCLGEPPCTPKEVRDVQAARDWEQRHLALEAEARAAVETALARRVVREDTAPPKRAPTFNPYLNDGWSRRKQALERFVAAARIVVTRNRAAARLAALRRFIAAAGRDPEKIAAIVASEHLQVQRASSRLVGTAPTSTPAGLARSQDTLAIACAGQQRGSTPPPPHQADPSSVRCFSFPPSVQPKPEHRAVPVPPTKAVIANFQTYNAFALKVCPDARMVEHRSYGGNSNGNTSSGGDAEVVQCPAASYANPSGTTILPEASAEEYPVIIAPPTADSAVGAPTATDLVPLPPVFLAPAGEPPRGMLLLELPRYEIPPAITEVSPEYPLLPHTFVPPYEGPRPAHLTVPPYSLRENAPIVALKLLDDRRERTFFDAARGPLPAPLCGPEDVPEPAQTQTVASRPVPCPEDIARLFPLPQPPAAAAPSAVPASAEDEWLRVLDADSCSGDDVHPFRTDCLDDVITRLREFNALLSNPSMRTPNL
eukprot:TRINITY_DN7495_c0_g1_i1.p1 TRINITY_DN7495_c0_g1~~TRINITY_DN7495_c0_g1_i1.p1  ORF type:complete len:860 (-),score=204.14 TRINITY_DN7495_c0_g1_i1:32-2278(-)